MQATRCAEPTLTSRRISTYTILGFTGYLAANAVCAVLASAWDLTLGERLVGFLAPPLAFLITVTIASAIARSERIVFYQTACAGVVSVVVVGLLTGGRVARLVDLATVGIGVFLVFGRIGCFSVACCHGTLGRGVVYGPGHVAVGFWRRWSGRALWPVQLIEAGASAAFVVIAIWRSATPGIASSSYIVAYAVLRFALELARGDAPRPYLLGVSEAQWIAVVTAVTVALWQRGVGVVVVAIALVASAVVLAASRTRRELFTPRHLRDLDRAMSAASDGARHETSRRIAISRHLLPEGTDWILSSEHPAWSVATARKLAHALFEHWEVVPGRTPGVIHIVTPRQGS